MSNTHSKTLNVLIQSLNLTSSKESSFCTKLDSSKTLLRIFPLKLRKLLVKSWERNTTLTFTCSTATPSVQDHSTLWLIPRTQDTLTLTISSCVEKRSPQEHSVFTTPYCLPREPPNVESLLKQSKITLRHFNTERQHMPELVSVLNVLLSSTVTCTTSGRLPCSQETPRDLLPDY